MGCRPQRRLRVGLELGSDIVGERTLPGKVDFEGIDDTYRIQEQPKWKVQDS